MARNYRSASFPQAWLLCRPTDREAKTTAISEAQQAPNAAAVGPTERLFELKWLCGHKKRFLGLLVLLALISLIASLLALLALISLIALLS